jgi:hypothetical protein
VIPLDLALPQEAELASCLDPPRVATSHQQVQVGTRGRLVWVDVELAPLLLLMWSAGIRTFASCQGGVSRWGDQTEGYIGFPTMDDVARFRALMGPVPGVWDTESLRFSGTQRQVLVAMGQLKLAGATPATGRPVQLTFTYS